MQTVTEVLTAATDSVTLINDINRWYTFDVEWYDLKKKSTTWYKEM